MFRDCYLRCRAFCDSWSRKCGSWKGTGLIENYRKVKSSSCTKSSRLLSAGYLGAPLDNDINIGHLLSRRCIHLTVRDMKTCKLPFSSLTVGNELGHNTLLVLGCYVSGRCGTAGFLLKFNALLFNVCDLRRTAKKRRKCVCYWMHF